MKLDVAIRYAVNKSAQLNAERVVNLYAEQASGISPVVLHSVPGLDLFTTAGTGPIRGMLKHAKVLYVVSGGKLYSVDSAGAVLEIGNILGSGRVSMATSGAEMVIVSSSTSYVFTGGTLSAITDPDFPKASSVTFLDNYFCFVEEGTGRFFISALGDATSYDALDFATAESNPDDLVRIFSDHRELLLFGEETVEPWTNTGAADFPFERVDGGMAEKGCAAANTVERIDNTVFWVDDDGIVRRLSDGYNPQRISSHEIEQAIAPYLSNLTAFEYTLEGHEFYGLNCDGGTYVYDAATQVWHERESIDLSRWRGEIAAKAYGLSLVGDYLSGKIYKQNFSSYQENGEDLVATMVFPPIVADGARFRVHNIELSAERGTGEGAQVRMDVSSDGTTWRTHGYRTLGALGKTKESAEWRRVGQHRRLYVRFIISDPYPRAIYAAYADIELDG